MKTLLKKPPGCRRAHGLETKLWTLDRATWFALLLTHLVLTSVRAGPNVVAWGNNDRPPNTAQNYVPSDLENAVAITGGSSHSLALKADGTVVAWGVSSFETKVPVGLKDAVAIAAGYFHSLALKADGTVTAWGFDSEGPTQVPPGLTNVVAIAAGGNQSLALKADGTVVAWGHPGQSRVPAGLWNVVAIAAGYEHSLALKADGTVVAWGDNDSGQINVPAELTDVVAIAAGGYHSLALKSDGTVAAWGFNDLGQIDVPDGLTNVVAVAGGYGYSLALIGGGSPRLGRPLAGRTVAYGTTVWLSITATGASPLSYQWRFNGTNLPGAAQATLVLTNLQFNQAGAYSVMVSNPLGAVASAEMVLGVLPLVAILQPQSQTSFPGATVSFSGTAAGPGPLSYQWQFNGVDLAGATNRTLVLTNVQLNQAGRYVVTVSNASGIARSAEATLSISLVTAWGGDDSRLG